MTETLTNHKTRAELTDDIRHCRDDIKHVADIQAEISRALQQIGERLTRIEAREAGVRIPVAGTVGRPAIPDGQAREDADINAVVTDIRAEREEQTASAV